MERMKATVKKYVKKDEGSHKYREFGLIEVKDEKHLVNLTDMVYIKEIHFDSEMKEYESDNMEAVITVNSGMSYVNMAYKGYLNWKVVRV